MSEVGGIFSEMMSFGEATGLTKEVAKAAGMDWVPKAVEIALELGYVVSLISIFDDLGGGNSNRQQNEALENQRQQLEELTKQMEEHQKEIQNHLQAIPLTGRILDVLEEHKARLCMAVPDAAEELDMLSRLWQQLDQMSPEEQAMNWEAASRLHRQARALEKEYLDYERRWLDACTEWTERWNALNEVLKRGTQFPLPVTTSNGQETIKIDCDYWSQGALQAAAETLPPLAQPEDTTLSGFSALMQQLDSLTNRVQEICQQAGDAFVAKERRIQLSNSILMLLEGRGWLVKECGFEQDDERQKITLKLKNPAQDTVTFVLNPDNTLHMQPKFINVHNRNVMESLAKVLQDALKQNGITINRVSHV